MQQSLLGATINQQKCVDLTLNDSVRTAVIDVKDDKFWKCIDLLLHADFPALRLLHYFDKNKPAKEINFFLSHRTSAAIKKLEVLLNDKILFGSLKSDLNLNQEGNLVLVLWGGDDNSDDEDIVFQDKTLPSERKVRIRTVVSKSLHPHGTNTL